MKTFTHANDAEVRGVSYSDIIAIPPEVCLSSLDENLKATDEGQSHKWIETADGVTCAECGTDWSTEKDF